jgi:hypothetical protein
VIAASTSESGLRCEIERWMSSRTSSRRWRSRSICSALTAATPRSASSRMRAMPVSDVRSSALNGRAAPRDDEAAPGGRRPIRRAPPSSGRDREIDLGVVSVDEAHGSETRRGRQRVADDHGADSASSCSAASSAAAAVAPSARSCALTAVRNSTS